MLPFVRYEDALARLVGTIVLFDGLACWVNSLSCQDIDSGETVSPEYFFDNREENVNIFAELTFLRNRRTVFTEFYDYFDHEEEDLSVINPKFEFFDLNLGYCGSHSGVCYYVRRRTRRRFKQGIDRPNLAFYDIVGNSIDGFEPFSSRGGRSIARALENNYVSFKSILEEGPVYQQEALSREVAISSNSNKKIVIFYKTMRVASIDWEGKNLVYKKELKNNPFREHIFGAVENAINQK